MLSEAYQQRFNKDRDPNKDLLPGLLQELEGKDNQIRVRAIFKGSKGEAHAAHLHQQIQNKDAEGILNILRDSPTEQRSAIAAAYRQTYGTDASADAASAVTGSRGPIKVMSSSQMAEFNALVSPNSPDADAAMVDSAVTHAQDALDFGMWGTGWGKGVDQDKLDAATKNLTPAQMVDFEAADKKRNGESFATELKNAGAHVQAGLWGRSAGSLDGRAYRLDGNGATNGDWWREFGTAGWQCDQGSDHLWR